MNTQEKKEKLVQFLQHRSKVDLDVIKAGFKVELGQEIKLRPVKSKLLQIEKNASRVDMAKRMFPEDAKSIEAALNISTMEKVQELVPGALHDYFSEAAFDIPFDYDELEKIFYVVRNLDRVKKGLPIEAIETVSDETLSLLTKTIAANEVLPRLEILKKSPKNKLEIKPK